jgi:hypothetical protein
VGVSGQPHPPGRALAPGKRPPLLIEQEVEWAPEPVWTQRLEEKPFSLCRVSNHNRPVIKPIARHYTDWATRPTDTVHTARKSTISIFPFLSTVPYIQEEIINWTQWTSKLPMADKNVLGLTHFRRLKLENKTDKPNFVLRFNWIISQNRFYNTSTNIKVGLHIH